MSQILACKACGSNGPFATTAVEYHDWIVDGLGNFVEDKGCRDSDTENSEYCCVRCDGIAAWVDKLPQILEEELNEARKDYEADLADEQAEQKRQAELCDQIQAKLCNMGFQATISGQTGNHDRLVKFFVKLPNVSLEFTLAVALDEVVRIFVPAGVSASNCTAAEGLSDMSAFEPFIRRWLRCAAEYALKQNRRA
jgi:hypothetical protein